MSSLGEKAWVETLLPRLQQELQSGAGALKAGVCTEQRLTYANEVLRYKWNDNQPDQRYAAGYQTDLLVFDHDPEKSWWIPRVVIECKIGAVTTHDALTYSAKASTHKHVHPYVRYGILIGNFGTAVPARLVRHGAYFDFMASWCGPDPTEREWSDLVGIVHNEIDASRTLQSLLSGRAKGGGKKFRLLHRPIILKES